MKPGRIVVISFLMFISLTDLAFARHPLLKVMNHTFNTDTIPAKDSIDERIFDQVDIEADFPGGESAWLKFLERNLNANTPVDNGAPAGAYTVWIQFVVGTDGKLSALKMLTHQGYGMETEVMRILRKSPPWSPAQQDGRTVKAYRKQPVTFVVIDDRKRKRRRD